MKWAPLKVQLSVQKKVFEKGFQLDSELVLWLEQSLGFEKGNGLVILRESRKELMLEKLLESVLGTLLEMMLDTRLDKRLV
jgi:hypothetical protein